MKKLNIKNNVIFAISTSALLALTACRFGSPEKPVNTEASTTASVKNSTDIGWDSLAALEDFNNKFDASPGPNNIYRRVQRLDSVIAKGTAFFSKVTGCKIETVNLRAYDPIQKKDGSFQLRMYTPSKNQIKTPSTKIVLLLPPTGGENKIDLGYADTMCNNNIKVAILEQWDGDAVPNNVLDLKSYDIGAIQAVAAIRHAIEYLNPNPNQLGILGTSVGGMQAVLTMGYESKISAALLIVSGMNLKDIIPVSVEENLTRWRNVRLGSYCIDLNICAGTDIGNTLDSINNSLANTTRALEKYKADVAANVKIEPSAKLRNSKVKNVWMAIASKDLTVPTARQLELRELLREIAKANNNDSKEHLTSVEISNDHVGSIMQLFLPGHHEMSDFFETNLIASNNNESAN